MVIVVLLVLALFVLQTFLPGRFRAAPPPGSPGKLSLDLGPRDSMPPHTVVGGRAQRALANMQEALPVFLALALMNMIVAPNAATAVTGAWIFLAARAVYVVLYLTGVPVARTLVWLVGWAGLAMMIAPLI